jgi:uncharacterized integral membrane protein (TIGR00698 family)
MPNGGNQCSRLMGLKLKLVAQTGPGPRLCRRSSWPPLAFGSWSRGSPSLLRWLRWPVCSLAKRPSTRLGPGIAFSSKKVLQSAVVLLGSGLSIGQVLSTESRSLPVLLGTALAALGMAWLAGRLFGLGGDVTTLVGIGTAICGASAIAATNAVIDADDTDVSYAIATIFTFNVVAVLCYPVLGHVFGLSEHAFGLWAGTAINDLSSVVAASTVYGHVAASYGVIVKLTRALAIIPICLGLALSGAGGATTSSRPPRAGE